MNQNQLQSNVVETNKDVDQMMVEQGHIPTPGEGSTPVEPEPLENGSGVPKKALTKPAVVAPLKNSSPYFGRNLSASFGQSADSIFGQQFKKLAQIIKKMVPKDYTVKVRKNGNDIDKRNLKGDVKNFFTAEKKKKAPALLDNVKGLDD